MQDLFCVRRTNFVLVKLIFSTIIEISDNKHRCSKCDLKQKNHNPIWITISRWDRIVLTLYSVYDLSTLNIWFKNAFPNQFCWDPEAIWSCPPRVWVRCIWSCPPGVSSERVTSSLSPVAATCFSWKLPWPWRSNNSFTCLLHSSSFNLQASCVLWASDSSIVAVCRSRLPWCTGERRVASSPSPTAGTPANNQTLWEDQQ